MKGQLCCNESRKSHRKIWPFSPFIDFVQTSHWFPHKLEPATETPALFICPLVENPGHRWKTWILSSPS
ncbi:hypothetical protein ERO13_D06G071750v2 [Gossypium hirsutum]|nr:hypothetical protein ERO13_D06G071750v2 [Gossypium hirsutum]